jgi:hypothetical protein
MEDVAIVPAWEPSPERKPVGERRGDLHEPIDTSVTSGFTFDFQKVDTPEAPAPIAERPSASAPEAEQSAPDFPIPEFGVPIGRGPAAARSDEEVDGREQHTNFREIMNENFEHPPRAEDETASTPVGRDGRPHLVALDGAPEQASPRIVHPGQTEKPLIPLDPDMTVEYDVLSAENSAEENAQLAWSQQFLGNREEQAPEPEQTYEEPEPRLLPPVRPVPDLVLATFPKPAEAVEPEGHNSEDDRNRRIGPATVEFRPVVDPDKDDPDDFAGAV